MTRSARMPTSQAMGRGRMARLALWSACLLLGLAGLVASFWPAGGQAQGSAPSAVVLRIDGVIGPAVADYITDGLRDAALQHDLAILEIYTPGGLDTSTRVINDAILNGPIPVVGYVSPSGARAASAGTFIMYATHVAAMAPSTNLGAATPIQLGAADETGGRDPRARLAREAADAVDSALGSDEPAEGEAPTSDTADDSANGFGQTPGTAPQDEAGQPTDANQDALARKVVNDAAAYIRGLAELRGRNAEWAEQAVREGVSLSSSEALELNVIDLIAEDLPDLLAQIDGRTVQVAGRGDVTLATEGMTVTRQEMTAIQRFLTFITDPNIAFILMQLGVLGLIIELYNPGSIFPGVVGLICLILGLTALSVLPWNAGGAALLVIGVIFMGLEFFVASGGILAVFGVIAFGVGAFFLFDADVPGLRISLPVILISTGVMAVLTFIAVGIGLAAQRREVVTGAEALIGQTGTVTDWNGLEGYIFIESENWRARSTVPLERGQRVRAVKIEGLIIWVEPAA